MSQIQHEIPINFIDGEKGLAIRTGNNAAWICVCNRREPLLGFSDVLNGPESSKIICPNCGRTFRVVAESKRKVPNFVHEL